MIASCSRQGVVTLGRRCPKPNLFIAKGPGRELRRAVSVVSRHAYDGKTLLVPGIPEANTGEEAEAAAVRFRAEIKRRMT